ncbi:MAG TPA: MBL fold metallo-hydrolase [Dehalococcoidia bacterium]|nr:MBL fold metallo-hydrolase [Dehalococcoidia bacterium]
MTEPQVTELVVRGIVVGVFQENCWVIGNRRTGEGICIDPGDQADDILHMASEMGVTIKAIANSHAHVDHILGVGDVQKATGAKFYMHSGEAPIAANAARTAKQFTGQDANEPPAPDFSPEDGDVVEVEGVQLRVIHTPGHTPGSLSYYTEGMLFSGDTLFAQSIGRTDLPGGDFEQEMSSIIDKLLVLPDETVVLPGHMRETRIDVEKQMNPFVLQEMERRRLRN